MKFMKILKSIGLYFIYPFTTFLLGIFTHIVYLDYFYPNKYNFSEETYFMEETGYEVAKLSSKITTCDTRYIVTKHDVKNNTTVVDEAKMPDKYLGMDRKMLEDALMEYQNNPTLEDMEKGFLNIQLESFSSDEVKVSKIYNPIEEPKGYYLMVLDGKIVVMEEDKETIYLTTDIYAEALSDSLKQELILGKFIYNIEDLYGFLESYTS